MADVLELAGLAPTECTCPAKWPYDGPCPWCMSPVGAMLGLAIAGLWLLFTLPPECKECPDCGRWSRSMGRQVTSLPAQDALSARQAMAGDAEEESEKTVSEPAPCMDCVIVRLRMRDGRNCKPGESGTWQVRHVIVCTKHQPALEKDLVKLAERMRAVCGAHSRV